MTIPHSLVLVASVFAIGIVSCASNGAAVPQAPSTVLDDCVDRAEQSCLFPAASLQSLSLRERDDYSLSSKALRLAAESKFSPSDPREFRAVWLRTFDAPIIVRLVVVKDACRFVVKRLSGASGYGMRGVDLNLTVDLNGSQCSELESVFSESLLFKWTYNPNASYPDGSDWVVEEKQSNRYVVRHYVVATGDLLSTPMARIANAVQRLSHVIEESHVY